MIRIYLMMLAVVLLLASQSFAQDTATQEAEESTQENVENVESPAELLAVCETEMDEIMESFMKKAQSVQQEIMEAGENEEEIEAKMMEAFEAFQKELSAAQKPVMEKAMKVAGMAEEDSDTSLAALNFVMNISQDEAIRKQACDLLVAHHLDNENLAESIRVFANGSPSQAAYDLLQNIRENSTIDANRALGAMGQVEMLEMLAQIAPMIEESPEYFESETEMVEFVKSMADETTDEAIQQRLEQIATEFGDVEYEGSTIGEIIQARIDAIRTRSQTKVGSVAPEIDGVDIEGVSFKLSDYRGQVVMLDFWGDW